MGIREYFGFAPREKRDFLPSYPDPNIIPSNATEGWGSYSGIPVSEGVALQHLAVYACVRLLADSIATMPRDVFRKVNGVRSPIDSPRVISDPAKESTPFEYTHQVVTSLALRGNSFEMVLSWDGLGYPTSLLALHPDSVEVTRNSSDGGPDYRYRDETTQGWLAIPRNSMIHIRRFTLAGSLLGLSPLAQARGAIGLGLAAERYGARWFKDSANPSAVLETDENLDPAEAGNVMKAWIDSHGGARHPAMLSGGLKYRPITITPNESQFLETRMFSRGEIASMYGIPPHMIGDQQRSTSWGTGIEQQSMGFVKFSLMPWLSCMESAYSRRLLPRGTYMKFNPDSMLRGDTATRYSAYTQARNAGWLNVNEIRALEDMAPVEDGGDDYLQPLNMGILGETPAPTPAKEPSAPIEPTPNADPNANDPNSDLTGVNS